jgi:hypothetical protein
LVTWTDLCGFYENLFHVASCPCDPSSVSGPCGCDDPLTVNGPCGCDPLNVSGPCGDLSSVSATGASGDPLSGTALFCGPLTGNAPFYEAGEVKGSWSAFENLYCKIKTWL